MVRHRSLAMIFNCDHLDTSNGYKWGFILPLGHESPTITYKILNESLFNHSSASPRCAFCFGFSSQAVFCSVLFFCLLWWYVMCAVCYICLICLCVLWSGFFFLCVFESLCPCIITCDNWEEGRHIYIYNVGDE